MYLSNINNNMLYCGKVKPQIKYITMSKEVWVRVKGFEDSYEVSNKGRCRSLDRRVVSSVGTRFSKGQILITDVLRDYHYVRLSRNQNKTKYSMHQLVALHFIPNPKNKPQVNHKDGDKSNNCVQNLEWVTDLENKIHAFENGLHSCAKLKPKDVRSIRKHLKETNLTQKEIADKHSICQSVVSRIKNNNYWSHVE